jgi:trehalose 6-phosphate synthase
VALGEILQEHGGIWFGWSGKTIEKGERQSADDPELKTRRIGKITLATIDLSTEDYDSYYLGYANGVLWPVFHYRLDLADFNPNYLAAYRRVNQLFARKLLPLLEPDDLIWIHDYHLIPLASELRALGCRQRIGFFLHIPMPAPLIMAAIPQQEWLMRSMFAHDLVGFQSQSDVRHFTQYVQAEARVESLGENRFRAFDRVVQAGAFPIGIDVDEFVRLAEGKEGREMYENMRAEYSRRKLLLGVDRLDYSKGLPQRLYAFRDLLERYPENRNSATLIQIASPSREDVEAYSEIRRELESLCGAINGDFGELDWMPIRYIHRTVARKRLPGLYRACRVALVTPLRDGMNLVAKEYIASQDPKDPGVLVLSRFAGAAEQLREALLVNPYDVQRTADAIQQALQMPLAERRERHKALLRRIREQDVFWWGRQFLETLQHRLGGYSASAEELELLYSGISEANATPIER